MTNLLINIRIYFEKKLKNVLQIYLKLMIHVRFKHVTFKLLITLKPIELIGKLCYKIINVVIYNTKIYNVYLMHM